MRRRIIQLLYVDLGGLEITAKLYPLRYQFNSGGKIHPSPYSPVNSNPYLRLLFSLPTSHLNFFLNIDPIYGGPHVFNPAPLSLRCPFAFDSCLSRVKGGGGKSRFLLSSCLNCWTKGQLLIIIIFFPGATSWQLPTQRV